MRSNAAIRFGAVCLFMATLAAQAAAEKHPHKLWNGARTPNDKYNWLRPPSSALTEAIAAGYEAPRDVDSGYSFKHDIEFDNDHVIAMIRLVTPRSYAILAGHRARSNFDDRPVAANVERQYTNRLLLTLGVRACSPSDMPSFAILANGILRRPSPVGAISSEKWNPCWFNIQSFVFTIDPGERIAGQGLIVFRWRGREKQAPIDFDYLW